MKRLLLLGLCALAMAACGKKGNPLPPLVRIPAAPGDFAVTRIDDQVYVRFLVPASNIDKTSPADVQRVDLYAITTDQPLTALTSLEAEELRELATVVASTAVRRPVLRPPQPPDGLPPIPVPPPAPGVDQGAEFVFREALTPDGQEPTPLPEVSRRRPEPARADVPRPLVAPAAGLGARRYYFAVGVSPRGRYGPHSTMAPAPLGETSGPPSAPVINVFAVFMTVRWEPPPDARLTPVTPPGLLESRPIIAGPPPTTYDLYEVPRNAPADAPLSVPKPLTPQPTAATEFTQRGITLGIERCFLVRAVDIIGGIHVRGPASPVQCSPFADTFPPTPPKELVAVAVPGGVNLLWEPSVADDLAGYLVLRGEPGAKTLTPLTKDPVTVPSYRDETVQAGVRYVYAVVAVDKAGNRSVESNRVEETAQ